MNVLFVVVFTTLFGFTFAVSEIGKPCTTPDGKSATCVPLNTCQIVINALSSKTNTPNDFLKKSYCGFEDDVLVCCESPGPVITLSESQLKKVLPDKEVCGLEREHERILGGTLTQLGEHPWMAALEYKSKLTGENEGLRCGGTLINQKFILTSAACLIDHEFELISVWLGEWKISTDPDCVEYVANKECADPVRKFNIKEITPHPYYSKRSGVYDIGLIKLETEVHYTDFIRPICLAPNNFPPPEPGTYMTVAGWGATENGTTSDVKLEVKVPIVSSEVCNAKLSNIKIGQNQICAGGEMGKDSCQGDTGHALMRINEDKSSGLQQWYQEGIVSRGVGCGRAGYPGIYTNVSGNMNWIVNVLSQA